MSTTVRVPRGARWSCSGSGFCCRMFELGPIDPECIARLDGMEIGKQWAPAGESGWYDVRPGPDGEKQHFLRKVDGGCVFLRPDNLCAIHALHGEDVKPGFCREYPLYIVHDPKGFVVIPRADCAGWHRTFLEGETVGDQVERLMTLPGLRAVGRFLPERVEIVPGTTVPVAEWMVIEEALLDALAGAPGSPEDQAVVVRERLASLVALGLPEPDPERYRLAARAVIETLVLVLRHVQETETAPGRFEADFTAHMIGAMTAAARALEAGQPTPAIAPMTRDFFDLVLRTHILGKLFRPLGVVTAGLGLVLAGTIVARAGVAVGPDGVLDHEQVGYTHAGWARLATNRAVLQVLQRARPALIDLFIHAA